MTAYKVVLHYIILKKIMQANERGNILEEILILFSIEQNESGLLARKKLFTYTLQINLQEENL